MRGLEQDGPASDHSTGGLAPSDRPDSGSATEGIYGLILATAVIAVSREYGEDDAGQGWFGGAGHGDRVLTGARLHMTVLGTGVSQEALTRAEVARAVRDHWALVEVAIPLIGVLALGAAGVVSDRTALVAATVLALVELAAAGGYAAIRHRADLRGTIVSAAIALVLGIALVLLKALVH